MKQHTITFERLESDYAELGIIRSIEVDHSRRRIIIVADEIETLNEGASVPTGVNLNSTYDEVPDPPLAGFTFQGNAPGFDLK